MARQVAELVRELLDVEARAEALDQRRKKLRAELEVIAREEHERSGACPGWKVAGAGRVTWCERRGRIVEAEPAKFLRWAEKHRPEAVVSSVAGWLVNELGTAGVVTPDGRLVDSNGVVVDGLALTPTTYYLSARLDSEAKRRAAAELEPPPPADLDDASDPPTWAEDRTAAEFLAGDVS